MNGSIKLAIGTAIVALGAVGAYALADGNINSITGMHSGIMGIDRGMMGFGMMNGNFGAAMQDVLNSNGTFDMNEMHRLMHGEEPDFDMNEMHQRMLSGNLTESDWEEMREEMEEHCPMMG